MSDRNKALAVLWFIILVNYLDRSAISFAGPAIMKSLSMTPAAFGLVLSSFGVGYALALVPGGMIADRYGTRIILVVTPLFWGVFTGMTGFVSTLAGFVLARFCLGVAEGVFSPSIFKSVGDHFDTKKRAWALAICLSALTLGPAIGGPLVGTLVNGVGWQVMFLLMGIPALMAGLCAHLFFPRRPADEPHQRVAQSEAPQGLLQVLRRPSLWILSLANMATDIAQWGFLGWLPSYLVLERGIDIKAAGFVGSVPYLFATVGLLLGGWIGSTRFHQYRAHIAIVCYFSTALVLALAYVASDIVLAVIGLSAAAFFMFAAGVSKGALAIDLSPPESRAAYIGFYNVAGQIGGASAPAIIGFLVHSTGSFAAGFTFMTAALCVAAICMIILVTMMASSRHAGRRPHPAA